MLHRELRGKDIFSYTHAVLYVLTYLTSVFPSPHVCINWTKVRIKKTLMCIRWFLFKGFWPSPFWKAMFYVHFGDLSKKHFETLTSKHQNQTLQTYVWESFIWYLALSTVEDFWRSWWRCFMLRLSNSTRVKKKKKKKGMLFAQNSDFTKFLHYGIIKGIS